MDFSSEATSAFVVTRGLARASVRPSDRTFRLSTVSRIIRPGKKVGHHEPLSSTACPSARMLPQDGSGGCTPALMNDSEASRMIEIGRASCREGEEDGGW